MRIGHGTRARYKKGCRCASCTEANRTYQRNWKAAWHAANPVVHDVDPCAVQRACEGDRTIALNRAEIAAAFRILDSRGCSAARIAERLGVSERSIVRWRSQRVALPYGRDA